MKASCLDKEAPGSVLDANQLSSSMGMRECIQGGLRWC